MKRWKSLVCVAALAIAVTAAPARAQSEASLVLSALPVASIVVGGSVGAAAVSVVPVALSVAGATLVLKAVGHRARHGLSVGAGV